jgi:hypothetical protein
VPWIVLTDANHVVSAEGFEGISEQLGDAPSK